MYADVEDDDLTFDLKRRIERDTKEYENRKAKRGLARRREQGCDEGRPKTGTKYDDDGRYLVPGNGSTTCCWPSHSAMKGPRTASLRTK